MSIEPYYMLKMQACEAQVRREIDREQVSHPMSEYQPGQPHYEQLMTCLADARRFWPASGEVNL